MKFCIALFVLVAVVAATASAAPARQQHQQMMYFQQQRAASRRHGQQAMLVHRYQAPKHALRRSSQQESGAFASGDSIEGATYIQDEPLQDGDAFSVAEAYPSEADDSSALLSPSDDAAAAAENDVYQPAEQAAGDDYEPQSDAAPAPAPVAPVAQDSPVAPPKKQHKKKVAAAAPAPVEDEDESADEFVPASVTKAGRRPSGGAGAGAAGLPHTFFPMNFGSTSGGAIAVANSFSTGKGGAASHAVAYGSASNAGPSKRRRSN